jgi:hypothetical protein
MKHKQFGFLHLMCGKQGHKGKRKLSVEMSFESTEEAYLFGFSVRLIFFFVGFAIEIEKKREEKAQNEPIVSQETSDDDSI